MSGAFTMDAADQAERRSAMLAEAIRHTAHVTGEINTNALRLHLINWAGVPEEECGGDICTIMFMMVRYGLYTTNTPDRFAAETRLKASRTLTAHLYEEDEPDEG